MTIWDDPETAAAMDGLAASYTFATEDLITFAHHCLTLGYLMGVIEPVKPPTATPYLDDDMEGAAGVGMVILEIARLALNAEGQVQLEA
jgi:hypothetical protein